PITDGDRARGKQMPYPGDAPFPDSRLRMVNHIDLYLSDGGPHGMGLILGSKNIDPEEWFFKAHFFQDPVWPGSLGLEAFVQLLKVVATERWGQPTSPGGFSLAARPHQWTYRGQVTPRDRKSVV